MPTEWFIDPVKGKDQVKKGNVVWGHSAAEAFKTHEFFRREIIADGLLQGDVEVNLLNDFDEADPVIIDFTLGPNAGLTYRGVKPTTILHAGAFTAVTPINRGKNQALEVTDTSVVTTGKFAAYPWFGNGLLNRPGNLPAGGLRRIRLTEGEPDAVGAIAYPCRDLGGGTVRTSPFGQRGNSPPTARRVTPAPGNAYVIESAFTRIANFAVDIRISPVGRPFPPGKVHLWIADLELNPNATHTPHVRASAQPVGQGPPTIGFTGCGVGHLIPQYANKVGFEFCRFDETHFQGTLVQLAGCCCLGEIVAFEGARVVAYADTLFQGHPLRVQGLARLGEVSFFDAGRVFFSDSAEPPNPAGVAGLQVEQGGMARIEPLLKFAGGGQAVYGNGHTGPGAKVRAGGCIVYDGEAPNALAAGLTVTGDKGDLDVAGTSSAWLAVSPDLAVAGKQAAVARND